MMAIKTHYIQGTGLHTGKLHARATRTVVMADDGFGNLRTVCRNTAYASMLPHGHVMRADGSGPCHVQAGVVA